MSALNSVVAIYDSHEKAEEAVKELQEAGINMKSLSIVGKDTHTEEHVVGYYNTGDRMKYWGKLGAFWGGFWGLLFGGAMFAIPGMGSVLVAGPLVAWIVAALESAAVVGGVSAIGAGLFSIGIPKDSILKYEAALKTDKFLLVIHGTPQDVERAKDIIANTRHTSYHVHKAAEAHDSPKAAASSSQSKDASKRLDRIADEMAVRGQAEEAHYDEDHDIFTH